MAERAIGRGRDSAHAARQTLFSNNTAAESGDGRLLPTMQHVEESAFVKVFDGLSTLAWQCEAAQCQPLEVFTSSMQCAVKKAILNGMDADPTGCKRQCEALQQRVIIVPRG